MTILQVQNLDVRYGQLKAVRDLSFDLAPGEVISLIGANGAGKSTLLRAIAGAHPLHHGSIRFQGRDCAHQASHARVAAGMALVPEGRRLFATMTVRENLRLGRISGRDGIWNIDKVLEVFPNLGARLNAKAQTLSGGEQQATAIGRALMSNPDFIMLDEVSLGLAPLVVDQVYGSLNTLRETGTTILLVEQDLMRAMSFSSRAICMLEGQIVLDKPMSALSREQITDAYFGLHKRAPTAGAAS